jgi:large subunit ribosomal protein L21
VWARRAGGKGKVFAVLETGGKQYRAAPGEIVEVEKLPAAVGEKITFERVLMVADGADIRVGRPIVEGARVVATVVLQARYRKVTWFHYSQKKRERNKGGHRQHFTRLRIEQIQA